MSQGIKCWDSSGQVILDITDSLARYVNSYTIPSLAPRSSTTISVPGYSLDGNWFIYFLAGDVNDLAITEQANGIYVFNTQYYVARGNVNFNIFRK